MSLEGSMTPSRHPKIDGKVLDESDIGRLVTYTAAYPPEQGVLSSFRDDGKIFVRFRGPTGELCRSSDLTWTHKGADE